MKVGLNVLLWTAAATEEHLPLLESLKVWGYDGVEFPMFDPACSPWARLSARLGELEMGRTAVTIVPETANPIDPDAAVRQAGVEHLRACLDACAELGAETLVGPLYSPCGKLVGRGPTAEEFGWAVETMRTAAEYAETLGINLAVEPLNRFETYFLSSIGEALRLVEAVAHPRCGVLYDSFHANIEEKDPVGVIAAVAQHINHVHISENDRGTPGTGHVPFAETFEALVKCGYDGWLTVEAFGRALPEVAAATCIWRDMIDSEDALAASSAEFIRDGWRAAGGRG
jgi:D-psicose/D-tagatose/L-ribulose 3-epimerase